MRSWTSKVTRFGLKNPKEKLLMMIIKSAICLWNPRDCKPRARNRIADFWICKDFNSVMDLRRSWGSTNRRAQLFTQNFPISPFLCPSSNPIWNFDSRANSEHQHAVGSTRWDSPIDQWPPDFGGRRLISISRPMSASIFLASKSAHSTLQRQTESRFPLFSRAGSRNSRDSGHRASYVVKQSPVSFPMHGSDSELTQQCERRRQREKTRAMNEKITNISGLTAVLSAFRHSHPARIPRFALKANREADVIVRLWNRERFDCFAWCLHFIVTHCLRVTSQPYNIMLRDIF